MSLGGVRASNARVDRVAMRIGSLIANWNTLPGPVLGGPTRCQPMCQPPLVPYPDVFFSNPLFTFTIHSRSFVNYVFDSRHLLMAFIPR